MIVDIIQAVASLVVALGTIFGARRVYGHVKARRAKKTPKA